MDYTKFNVEDFAANESFIDWVKRSDPEAVKHWELYISQHPEIHSTVDKARTLVLNLERAESAPHNRAQIDSMWANIQGRIGGRSQVPLKAASRFGRVAVLASVAFLVICVAGVLWYVLQTYVTGTSTNGFYAYQNELPDFAEKVNNTAEPLRIVLADGSAVTLAHGSHLKYKLSYQNDSTRSVYLMGEAFFDVSKNPYKPFIVHSDEVFVEVLGTSFRVAAPENGKDVIVSVKTGKVSVYAMQGRPDIKDKDPDQKGGVVLLPNQQVYYKREQQSFEKTFVDSPEILNSKFTEDDFAFENTPIAEVFKTIELAYGIKIIFNEETMKDCYLTAPLGSEPMMDKLKIICQTIGASFKVIDAQVVVSSRGC